MTWSGAAYKDGIQKAWVSTQSAGKGWVLSVNPPQTRGGQYGMYVSVEKKVDSKRPGGYNQVGIYFIIDGYQACCAFYQLNHFSYHMGHIEEAEVHQIMDDVLRAFEVGYTRLVKLVINTVETQQSKQVDDDDGWNVEYVLGFGRNPETSIVTDIKVQGTGGITYPYIHTWCKKQKGCLDTPVVNSNTSRIIHHMIVMPDVTQVSE